MLYVYEINDNPFKANFPKMLQVLLTITQIDMTFLYTITSISQKDQITQNVCPSQDKGKSNGIFLGFIFSFIDSLFHISL